MQTPQPSALSQAAEAARLPILAPMKLDHMPLVPAPHPTQILHMPPPSPKDAMAAMAAPSKGLWVLVGQMPMMPVANQIPVYGPSLYAVGHHPQTPSSAPRRS